MNVFKQKMRLIPYLFLRQRPAKNVVRYVYKSPTSDYTSKRNMVNGCQLCLNLSEKTCTIFIDQLEGSLVAKTVFQFDAKA